jgi:hypothetical protein
MAEESCNGPYFYHATSPAASGTRSGARRRQLEPESRDRHVEHGVCAFDRWWLRFGLILRACTGGPLAGRGHERKQRARPLRRRTRGTSSAGLACVGVVGAAAALGGPATMVRCTTHRDAALAGAHGAAYMWPSPPLAACPRRRR